MRSGLVLERIGGMWFVDSQLAVEFVITEKVTKA